MRTPDRRPWLMIALSIFACCCLLSLPACNTVEGAGEDIEDAGDGIQDAAD